jgi:uroporphyrinogen-III synthase
MRTQDQAGREELGLAGLVVGIPAARRAGESAELIRRHGGIPIVGPAIEEVPVPDEAILRATAALIDHAPTWSVHLTGVGTKRWFGVAEAHGMLVRLLQRMRNTSIVARGAKARAALRTFDLDSIWTPPDETSASIADWLGPRLSTSDAVVLQYPGEPAHRLLQTVASSGARVVEIAPYRWTLPDDRRPAERLATALAFGEVDVLLITSAPQLRLLIEVARSLAHEDRMLATIRERVFVGAVGDVAAVALHDNELPVDLIASPARLGALVRGVAAARDRVLDKRLARVKTS